MSRKHVENDKYSFAFGVDHTPMGCFFQIWEKAAAGENPEYDEMDLPQVCADEHYGVVVHNGTTLSRNSKLNAKVKDLQDDLCAGRTALRNEETIIGIGKTMGFDMTKEVYELWD